MHDLVVTAAAARPRRLWPAALAGFAALLVGIGLARFGYAPLLPALVEAGWFDTAAADALGATNLAGYVLGAALAGRLALRVSARRLLPGSMLAAAISFAACALDWGFAWYFAWRLISGAAGGLLMVLAAPAILGMFPTARRGRAGGIVFAGVGLGIAFSGTLVPVLLRAGLAETWIAFAAAAAVLALYAHFALPCDVAEASVVAAKPARRNPPRALAMLTLAYAFTALGFVPHTVFWVDYIARGVGAGIDTAGVYWALLGVAAAMGPLATGVAADRIGLRATLAATLFGMAAAVALPLISSTPAALALSSVGVGALTMAATALAAARAAELAPIERQRRVWGRMTMIYAIVYAAGGYGMAAIHAATGTYGPIFAVGAVALVLAGGFAAAGRRQ